MLRYHEEAGQKCKFASDAMLSDAHLAKFYHCINPFVHTVMMQRILSETEGVEHEVLQQQQQQQVKTHHRRASRRPSTVTPSISGNAQEEVLDDEAELRPIYTIFAQIAGIEENATPDITPLHLMGQVMDIAKDVRRYHGNLRQFICDDKGTVLIFTFGLRGEVVQKLHNR